MLQLLKGRCLFIPFPLRILSFSRTIHCRVISFAKLRHFFLFHVTPCIVSFIVRVLFPWFFKCQNESR